jgi:hypothetical protein
MADIAATIQRLEAKLAASDAENLKLRGTQSPAMTDPTLRANRVVDNLTQRTRDEVKAWLTDQNFPATDIWSVGSGSIGSAADASGQFSDILLEPGKQATQNANGQIERDLKPELHVTFIPWNGIGAELASRKDPTERAYSIGVCHIHDNRLISVSEEEVKKFRLPDHVQIRSGYYTLTHVMERMASLGLGQRHSEYLTGAFIREMLFEHYSLAWNLEDVQARNRQLAALAGDEQVAAGLASGRLDPKVVAEALGRPANISL